MFFLSKCLKKSLGIFLFVLFVNPVFAINEIQDLEDSENSFTQENNTIELQIKKENILEKIFEPKKENKYLKKRIGEPTGSAFDLLRSSGYTFESGPIKNQKFRYFFHGGGLFNAQTHEDLSATTSIAANEFHSETLFANNKTRLLIAYNFSKKSNYSNKFFQKFSSLYLTHAFNDNQTLEIGETRVPVGYEGGISSSSIKMFSRSQIARNLGNYYSNGIKNIGNYKYLDYNIGVYDGSRSFNNNFQGYEFAALTRIKPLAKFDGKYGDLYLGGTIDSGNSANAYTVVGGHAIYNYKKLYADFEYLYANGLSGFYYGRGRAHGLYSTVGYFIHPKIELLARYDFYQNLNNNDVSQEFSTGLTYYFHPKVKLLFQYIYAMKDTSSNPSHKIYLGADFTSAFLLDIL